jgi:hypothetical protein
VSGNGGLAVAIQSTGQVPDAVAINAGVGVAGDFARDNALMAELALIGLNVTEGGGSE